LSDSSAVPSITIEGTNVTVAGNGFKHEVSVQPGETVESALDRIGVDASRLGVDLLVNGTRRDASEVTADDIEDGSTLAAPPKQPSLG